MLQPQKSTLILYLEGDSVALLAKKYAFETNRLCLLWNENEEIERFNRFNSILLIASGTRVNESHVRKLTRNCTDRPRLEFGLITGESHIEIENQLKMTRANIQEKLAPPWIISERPLEPLPNNGFRWETGDSILKMHELQKNRTQLGILVGHGREDVLYLSKIAICGKNKSSTLAPSCTPTNCPYPQEKFPVRNFNAKYLCILSCSAGKIGSGLFPMSSRLGFGSIESSSLACITTRSLFTLDNDLVEEFLECLEHPTTLGALAKKIGDFYEI